MQVIFLGTNGWFDTDTGNTICTLIKTKTCNIILDAGFGIYKADRYLENKNPTFLFLSHLHLDHTVGMHALAKFKFPKGLTVITPVGTKTALNKIIAQPFTIAFKNLSFKVNVLCAKKQMRFAQGRVQTAELVHQSRCFGYRFEFQNKVITYCTDTGVCENILKLAQGADLLITECALRQDQDDQGWPHLDPTHAANLAKKSKARKLVLTHFDADNYPTKKARQKAQVFAKKIFPQTLAAYDSMKLSV
ncbi:MAG: MBL fold metallo-hydrolase [Candidatus Omnitrophota bacterium]